MQRIRGNGEQALAAYQASLEIRRELGARNPDDIDGQRDISISHDKIGDVLREAQRTRRRACLLQRRPHDRRKARRARSAGHAVAARPRRQQHQDRQRAARAGRSRRRTCRLSGEPGNDLGARGERSRQHRLAARPFGQPGEGRRRPAQAGRPRGRARRLRAEPADHAETGGKRRHQCRLAARPVDHAGRDRQSAPASSATSTAPDKPLPTACRSARCWQRRNPTTRFGSATW